MGLEKISEYKKKLNLTTEELSEKSGVPVGTLNKILSGATKDPKLETLKAIAKVLGLSLDDFDDSKKSNEHNDIAETILNSPELKTLFEMTRDMSPEMLQAHIDFMKKMLDLEQK